MPDRFPFTDDFWQTMSFEDAPSRFGESLPLSGSTGNTKRRRLNFDGMSVGGMRASRSGSPEAGEEYLQLLEEIVGFAVSRGASDVHLRVGRYPAMRIDGELVPLEAFDEIAPAGMEAIITTVLNAAELDRLEHSKQVDTSGGFENIGRIRLNVFFQRGTPAIAVRIIRTDVPTLDELGVPEVIARLGRLRAGLVLVTGATGMGKSTTLAALVDTINREQSRHIITIEDPIEFLFRDRESMIDQREIGIDAVSFHQAMEAALREDPDVIMVSDLRSTETMEFAMTAAETGHLVLGTLHAPTAPDTITRIVSTFPAEAQNTIRAKLSQNLKAIVAQRLLPAAASSGRVLACETMIVTPRIQELILDPMRVGDIADMLIKSNAGDGLKSFDRFIHELFERKRITRETAVRFASSPNEMGLMLRGFSS